MLDNRQAQLHQWLVNTFDNKNIKLQPLSGDAGFRRYYRFMNNQRSLIAVDAPNEYCNNAAFIDMESRLLQSGVACPQIIAVDKLQGYFCLSDLGNTLLADTLTLDKVKQQYVEAIDILPKIALLPASDLPLYDQAFVLKELEIFTEWLLGVYLNISLSTHEQKTLQTSFDFLIDNAVSQPKVVMHRDFHSRNLMWHENALAVIDFQDAVVGPVVYDLVSLLRDCYVKWPQAIVDDLLRYYVEQYGEIITGNRYPLAQWVTWFDLMGIQRHLKAAGIFARLKLRDNKPGYMKDIPLTLSYVIEITQRYPALSELRALIANKVLPMLVNRMQ